MGYTAQQESLWAEYTKVKAYLPTEATKTPQSVETRVIDRDDEIYGDIPHLPSPNGNVPESTDVPKNQN